jgi:hypothetical protein
MNSTLITSKHGHEIWARWDNQSNAYELFFEQECESYTGSMADTLKDAESVARYILEEQMCEQHDWYRRCSDLLDDA